MQESQKHPDRFFLLAALVVGAVTVLRLVTLAATELNLGPEEAQYWTWSRAPAFGYYSKPPLIAWLIGLSTSVCGDGEWCIRFPSPLLHCGTSLVLFFLARDMYDARTGFWSAVTYATVPGVWYSSGLMTVEAPLLFFWSVTVLAFRRLIETGANKWAVIFGCALGFGLLSKYAMAYFLICAAAYYAVRPAVSKPISVSAKILAGAIPVIIFSPNIVWNARNGFLTWSHTIDNVNLDDGIINPINLLEFVGAQFGVFGPILFAILVWASLDLIRKKRLTKGRSERDIFLLSFGVPVLVIVAVLSFTFKANANWAAPAFLTSCVFVVAWLLRQDSMRLMYISHGLHGAFAIFLIAVALSPSFAGYALNDESIDKVSGWDELADHVHALVNDSPFEVVLTDHRPTMAELLYYGRSLTQPVLMWDRDGVPQNHYELTAAFTAIPSGPILLLAVSEPTPDFLLQFEERIFLKNLEVPIRENYTRAFMIYMLNSARDN